MLPKRMDLMIDDVEIGASLRNLETNMNGILIDWVGPMPNPVIVKALDKFHEDAEPETEEDCTPRKPEDYEIIIVDKVSDWLVLANGHGHLLVD